MAAKSSIEWTDATWSPLRARVKSDAPEIAATKGYTSLVQIAAKMAGHVGQHCEHISEGCRNCYSGTEQHRCLPNNGTGLPFDRRSRDLVESFVDEKALKLPLKWRTPKKIFVENQSDLFGEWHADEMISIVFGVMAATPEHTYQVLTKRIDRAMAWFQGWADRRRDPDVGCIVECSTRFVIPQKRCIAPGWPLPNVWLGVSVEDQATADARIPLLLQVPAAIRFISYEPALGPVDFNKYLQCFDATGWCSCGRVHSPEGEPLIKPVALDQIIIGGESGRNSRPFDIAWARQAITQCRDSFAAR